VFNFFRLKISQAEKQVKSDNEKTQQIIETRVLIRQQRGLRRN